MESGNQQPRVLKNSEHTSIQIDISIYISTCIYEETKTIKQKNAKKNFEWKNVQKYFFFFSLLLIPNLGNWLFSCLNLSFYLLLNMTAKGVIGAGDIKLSFLLALQLGSVTALVNSLSFTWILGGLYALISRSPAIAFVPFMICGIYLARIL